MRRLLTLTALSLAVISGLATPVLAHKETERSKRNEYQRTHAPLEWDRYVNKHLDDEVDAADELQMLEQEGHYGLTAAQKLDREVDRAENVLHKKHSAWKERYNEHQAYLAELEAQEAAAVESETTTEYAGSGVIPDYVVACESGGSYTAYNESSGAYGKYQIIPSTAAAYGCDLSTPAGQDSCAAEILAGQGPGAWSCW